MRIRRIPHLEFGVRRSDAGRDAQVRTQTATQASQTLPFPGLLNFSTTMIFVRAMAVSLGSW
jgi:hypothetical protein